jgi:hypothetical protein
MTTPRRDFGMDALELHRFVERMLEPEPAAHDDFGEAAVGIAPPVDQAARRLAWEAAGALIAANNRRLTEQLRALGLHPRPAGAAADDVDLAPPG